MQTRYSEENSVRLSVRLSVRQTVRLSVTRVYCDKTEQRSAQIYTPYERTFILVFGKEDWLVGGVPFYLKFWVNRPPWSKIADFQPIIAHSSSAVTPSEKRSINANRKSTHYTLSNEPKMIIVRCP